MEAIGETIWWGLLLVALGLVLIVLIRAVNFYRSKKWTETEFARQASLNAWRWIKAHPIISGAALLAAILLFYTADWSGFNAQYTPPFTEPAKDLWDWLQLLIVPAILAIGGVLISATIQNSEHERTEKQAETERKIAEDQLHEQRLQTYLDRMTELLLDKGLGDPNPSEQVRNIARSRTLTTLRVLAGNRKGALLKFLYESNLIGSTETSVTVVQLREADFSHAQLARANFQEANLESVNLEKAILRHAHIKSTNLTRANLQKAELDYVTAEKAILNGANLNGATLVNAILNEAKLQQAQLAEADLSGALLESAKLRFAKLESTKLAGSYCMNASFIGAKLNDACLDRADLSAARFLRAELNGASLVKARLMIAKFHKAELTGANLTEAELLGTNLMEANLTGADLTDAKITGTIFLGADLTGAKITPEQLAKAILDVNTTLPNGTKWTPPVNTEQQQTHS